MLTAVATVVASLVAARSLIGRGALAGRRLPPAAPTLTAAWHAAWEAIPGAQGQSAPPWLAFVALGRQTLLAGQPEWFVTLLICGIVPLSC